MLYKQLIPSRVIAYLDPPYMEKASHLYRNSFDPRGGYGGALPESTTLSDQFLHEKLAQYLNTKAQFRWLLSYDNNPLLTRAAGCTNAAVWPRDRTTATT